MCRLLFNAIVHQQMAGDIPCWTSHQAGGGDKEVGVILADSDPSFRCIFSGGLHARFANCVGDGLRNCGGKRMQTIKFASATNVAGQTAYFRSGFG